MWCITGGSPCQDLSIAGKRAGLAGARSGLFMEQVRIVKEMREADKRNGRTGDMVRPRYLVWENVVGAFSSNKGKDFAAVLEEIIKIVEPEAPGIEVPEKGWPTWGGYHDEVGGRWSVVWRTHDAQYWGVPQRRRRISVVADFGGDTASEIQFDRESLPGDIAESGASGEGPAEAAERGFNSAIARSLTARADGSPCADRGPNIVCSPHHGVCEDVSHALRAKANCAYREDAETYPVQNMVVRRLTPMECERLQGFPDHWTDIGEWIDEKGKKHKDADSPRYKALGNSIALPFWDWMLRRMARYLPEGATLGSLFDGISGFNVCWARIHGAECCRWSSEIEQFPIAVAKKHFGDEKSGEKGDWDIFSGGTTW